MMTTGVARLLSALVLSTSVASIAVAQQEPAAFLPRSGERARLMTVGGDRVTGTVRRVGADTIQMTAAGRLGRRLEERTVAVDQLREIWRSRGRSHGRGALRGLWMGPLFGFALGAAIGAAATDSDAADCDMCPAGPVEGALLGGGVGLILGIPIGLTVGAVHGIERWERSWRMQPRPR